MFSKLYREEPITTSQHREMYRNTIPEMSSDTVLMSAAALLFLSFLRSPSDGSTSRIERSISSSVRDVSARVVYAGVQIYKDIGTSETKPHGSVDIG